jgi:glucose-6-phosphate 1-dehydrogenase
MAEYTFMDQFCIETRPEPCGVIIFGASGDLTHRKLIPALFHLFQKELIPDTLFILGCARSSMTDEVFQQKVHDSLIEHSQGDSASHLADFIQRCYYLTGDYNDPRTYAALAERLKRLDAAYSTGGNHIFYLAVPPNLYAPIAGHLGSAGLTNEPENASPWARVIVEKPFGRDMKSAMALDKEFQSVLDEGQIYRIDHYLGKETVQNILIFRFANAIFEPIWNRRYIDHVQITVAESIGVEHRAGYYEQTGVLRDMFQNHMLQMLALVAMEPPASFTARWVRDEKVKLLRAVRPFPLNQLDQWVVRGQYGPGQVNGREALGYRQEKGVAPGSRVETFVAAKMLIDNWRWQGVPFYLRSGKRLAKRVSEIAITFKNVPHSMFGPLLPDPLSRNVLVLNVQPEEGISLTIEAKQPGARLCMGSLTMAFDYRKVFGGDPPEAYERLLLDCMLGDQTLFIRHDDVEAAWSLLDPILKMWEFDATAGSLCSYPSGGWGPAESDALLERDGRRWRTL